jgi:hypothetical protein
MSADRREWSRMHLCLWPDESSRGHYTAIDEILDSQDAWSFVAVTAGGALAGFAGISEIGSGSLIDNQGAHRAHKA